MVQRLGGCSAITNVHQGGGLAARTPGVLTMHARSGTSGVCAADSKDQGPEGMKGKMTDGQVRTELP